MGANSGEEKCVFVRGTSLCLGVLITACGYSEVEPVNVDTEDPPEPVEPVPLTAKSFTEIAGDVLNPERGWYTMYELYPGHPVDFGAMRSQSDPVAPTLALLRVDLDQGATNISASWLAEI